jgi:nucleoside-diphosphate-sugar epimerase/pimeloyl-ACP methyl ester carboxylesterase
MKNADAEVLVTGATGLIGRWLVAALTARGRNVVALVRGAPQREPELRAFVRTLGGDDARLLVVSGDVESPTLGLSGDWSGVRDVFHLAARFAFGLSPSEARRANVEGTLHVLTWSNARPSLRRFVFLGGYRMTRPTPAIASASAALRFPLDARAAKELYAAHGAYEASKHESALAFRAFVAEHGLPFTAVHPSGVIGDSRTGETTQLVGFGETVERLWEQRLPALVGTPRTFVPVVPVDYVASFLATVPERAETCGQHLTVLDPRTPELPELVRGIARHLHVPAPSVVLPVGVVRALPPALTGVQRETLHFLSEDRYDTAAAEAHAAAVGLARPDLEASLARWCDHLVSTRFGADPSGDRGALRDGTFSVGDPERADVVYLHGLPWNGDVWKPVDDRVGSGARLDLAGLGRSSPSHEHGLAWLERALAGRTKSVLLVGHSLGAGLAVRYAHAHPEQVRGVVLVSPAFLQRRASPWLRIPPLVARMLRKSTPAALSARLLPELATAPLHPAVTSASSDLRRRGVALRVSRALAAASRPHVREALQHQLAALRCQVVLVHGEHDPLVVEHTIPSVHTIGGTGHVPQLTHVEEVAAIVRKAKEAVLALADDGAASKTRAELLVRAPDQL